MYNPSKQVWLNPNIQYLFDNEIIEYDMQDAGFSLIKQFKLLPDEKIAELTKLGKGLTRHITIGKLQGEDPIFSKSLSEKFEFLRKLFITSNNLSDNEILAVKKDAIFAIGTCSKIKFGTIQFIPKNTYSSYIRFPDINNLEIYYNKDQIDVKGISDSVINRHRLFMLDFMRTIIPMIESKDIKARRYLNDFIMDYKQHNLDDGYYLEFNNKSRDMNPLFNYREIIIKFLQIVIKEI